VPNARRIIITIIPASAWAYWLCHTWWIPIAFLILLTAVATVASLLVLPAVWSGKAYRRNAAYRLAELILRSRRSLPS
jgi:hypothetical protein